MATEYLTGEKFPLEIIERQRALVLKDELFREIVEKLPYPVLIMNSLRQIVYYNNALLESFPDLAINSIIGGRPGEVFKCQYAGMNEGCGTTRFCRTCGAAKAIVASLAGREDIEECRITTVTEEAYDYRVWTYPKVIDNERFSIFTLIDISHEKRREMLERIFYHDILNTVNGIKGFLEMYFSENDEKDELIITALNFTRILIDEINSQRLIFLAETGELEVSIETFPLNELIRDILQIYQGQINFKSVKINLDIDENIVIKSDKTLLRRIIINLIKNAIEASTNESTIRISAKSDGKITSISVYNEQVMPEEVKLQIFKRSFSTKGKGRGLGTYSIKLLTEKFLKGKVTFISEKDFGTEFTITIPNLES